MNKQPPNHEQEQKRQRPQRTGLASTARMQVIDTLLALINLLRQAPGGVAERSRPDDDGRPREVQAHLSRVRPLHVPDELAPPPLDGLVPAGRPEFQGDDGDGPDVAGQALV
jgi:hypothetical protein